MFKSVEYAGFDGKPELRALAERATAVLGGLIRSWRDEVEVTWRPATSNSRDALELTLALTLPNATGSTTGRIRQRAFDPDEESLLRMDLREVWLDLLDVLLAQMATRREKSLADLVEA
jgi:hypothetical protein